MLLATVLFSVALAPQAAPSAAPTQEPSPAVKAADLPAPGPVAAHIDAGIAAFQKRRFAAARAQFEEAVAADPQSAAAAYYLGYTFYKLGEPSRRMSANKERAKELFAKAFQLDPTFTPAWGK
jgi:tetratricopeptide (TPR) repeat protein